MSEYFPPAGRGQDSCLCVGVSACECVKLCASQRQQVRNEHIGAYFYSMDAFRVCNPNKNTSSTSYKKNLIAFRVN